MKRWDQLTNDELALHLEFWTVADGSISSDNQKQFFEEVTWRLRLMLSAEEQEKENDEHVGPE